jgi:hypothetical protein
MVDNCWHTIEIAKAESEHFEVLIALDEGDYAFDLRGGRPGLAYTRKREHSESACFVGDGSIREESAY